MKFTWLCCAPLPERIDQASPPRSLPPFAGGDFLNEPFHYSPARSDFLESSTRPEGSDVKYLKSCRSA